MQLHRVAVREACDEIQHDLGEEGGVSSVYPLESALLDQTRQVPRMGAEMLEELAEDPAPLVAHDLDGGMPVDPLEEEADQGGHLLFELLGERHDRLRLGANLSRRRGRADCGDSPTSTSDGGGDGSPLPRGPAPLHPPAGGGR